MSDMPELREGPPWAMEEMIKAQPGLVEPIMNSSAALEAAESLREGGPITIVGCGTSEHAAMAGSHLIDGARARDAFEAWLDPQEGGVLIAISHEAGTAATLAAMRAAAANGARTILITARPEADSGADITVGTPLVDTSWCHTVESERILAVGSGVDEVTAREISLKIEEGVHVPVTPLGIEKVLHGHLPAADDDTGLIVFRLDPSAAEQRDKRAGDVLAAVAELAMPAILIDDLPEGHPLLAGAVALQLVTLELVHLAGTNPDLIRREEAAYNAAADAAAS
jgi:glutamine---fructose-6-phosphate transaminase (isomerizing)